MGTAQRFFRDVFLDSTRCNSATWPVSWWAEVAQVVGLPALLGGLCSPCADGEYCEDWIVWRRRTHGARLRLSAGRRLPTSTDLLASPRPLGDRRIGKVYRRIEQTSYQIKDKKNPFPYSFPPCLASDGPTGWAGCAGFLLLCLLFSLHDLALRPMALWARRGALASFSYALLLLPHSCLASDALRAERGVLAFSLFILPFPLLTLRSRVPRCI